MGGEAAAEAVHQPQFGPCDLPLAALPAQLRDHLVEVKQRAGDAGMGERQQAAMGVGRNLPAIGGVAVGDEAAAFALRAEAEVLQHHDDCAGEAIVDAGDIHVLCAIARHAIGPAAGLDRAGGGQ